MNLVSISLSNSILVNFFVTQSAQVKNSPMFNKNVFQSHFSQTVRECKKHVTPCFPTIFFLRTGLCMDIYIYVYIYIYIYIYTHIYIYPCTILFWEKKLWENMVSHVFCILEQFEKSETEKRFYWTLVNF